MEGNLVMIKDRVIPNIEVSPKVYAFHFKLGGILHSDGRKANFEWENIKQYVSYTYEGAVKQLQDELESDADTSNLIIFIGNINIVKFSYWGVNDIFNTAFEMYGDKDIEDITDPELFCEFK
jgi:hypothetical protein